MSYSLLLDKKFSVDYLCVSTNLFGHKHGLYEGFPFFLNGSCKVLCNVSLFVLDRGLKPVFHGKYSIPSIFSYHKFCDDRARTSRTFAIAWWFADAVIEQNGIGSNQC